MRASALACATPRSSRCSSGFSELSCLTYRLARTAVKAQLLGGIAQWVVPYRFYRYFHRIHRARAEAAQLAPWLALTAANASLRGIHQGRRCFVLCNGPGVKQQNLLPLAGEKVISVSNGYLHPDFGRFRPRYHCVPQITYGRLTEDDVVRWFGEMHERLGDAELFLSTTEQPLVESRRLFPGRKVRYLCLHGSLDERPHSQIPDISQAIPRVQSVPIMCLMLAMYLGFERIYLLGTEHDHFKTGEYKYFYEPTVLKGKDVSTNQDGQVVSSRYQEFHELAALWRQYRALREIAHANSIEIWNATAGGELDEFPRVRLEDVVTA